MFYSMQDGSFFFFFFFFSFSYFNYLSMGNDYDCSNRMHDAKSFASGEYFIPRNIVKKNGGDVSRHSCLPLMLFSCVFHFTDHALFNLKQSAVQLIK